MRKVADMSQACRPPIGRPGLLEILVADNVASRIQQIQGNNETFEIRTEAMAVLDQSISSELEEVHDKMERIHIVSFEFQGLFNTTNTGKGAKESRRNCRHSERPCFDGMVFKAAPNLW